MTRSKRDLDLARRTGRSASTIERYRAEGMLADPIERSLAVVEAVGLGSGRGNSYELVAYKAAIQFGWPLPRLRTELLVATKSMADVPAASLEQAILDLKERLGTFFSIIVRTSPEMERYEEHESFRLGGNFTELERAALGESADQLTAMETPSVMDFPVALVKGERPTEDASASFMAFVAADEVDETVARNTFSDLGEGWRSGAWRRWAESAPPVELVRAVRFADYLASGLLALSGVGNSEDKRWEFVKVLALIAGPRLAELGPVADAVLRSLSEADPTAMNELTIASEP